MTEDRNGYISVEGLEELSRALAAADSKVCEAAMQGLEAAAMNIVGDAQKNLVRNGNNASGLLMQSGHAERKGDEVTAGFFDTQNKNSGYALYVEFGRRAGRMPPPDDLAAWAYKKFSLKDWKEARALGWAWAKAIAKKGTQPHPFFVPAVNKNTKGGSLGGVMNSVAQAISKALRHSTAEFAAKARSIRNTPAT